MTLCLSKMEFPWQTLTSEITSTEWLQKIGPELNGMKSVKNQRPKLREIYFIHVKFQIKYHACSALSFATNDNTLQWSLLTQPMCICSQKKGTVVSTNSTKDVTESAEKIWKMHLQTSTCHDVLLQHRNDAGMTLKCTVWQPLFLTNSKI